MGGASSFAPGLLNSLSGPGYTPRLVASIVSTNGIKETYNGTLVLFWDLPLDYKLDSQVPKKIKSCTFYNLWVDSNVSYLIP